MTMVVSVVMISHSYIIETSPDIDTIQTKRIPTHKQQLMIFNISIKIFSRHAPEAKLIAQAQVNIEGNLGQYLVLGHPRNGNTSLAFLMSGQNN